jgi:hypothetical protein
VPTLRTKLARLGWLGVFALGSWLLLRWGADVFGDHWRDLWVYQKMEHHRFTSMAMLTGTLRLQGAVGHAGHDDQVYNGAVYTNWGFGVPLMELPFHAVGRHMRSLSAPFFPDRCIFFVYLAGTVPLLWAGLDRLVALRTGAGSSVKTRALSWCATAFALCVALYPLLASRFLIWEETVAYLVLVELAALSVYVFAVTSNGYASVALLGALAGLGLLVRTTGLVYLACWGTLLVLERRTRRTALAFCAAALPFVAFWAFSNWVRTGVPWSAGYQDTLPGWEHQVPIMRFGSLCSDTRQHGMQAVVRLFAALFMQSTSEPDPWMKQCRFDFEPRGGGEGGIGSGNVEPYFGVAVLAMLLWSLLHHLARREQRLAAYVPHIAVALLFGMFVWAGVGFTWRYTGDFWPLFVLIAVEYVRRLPPATARLLLGWPLAAVLFTGAVGAYRNDVAPWKGMVKALEERDVPKMWDDFTNLQWGMDRPMPSTLRCGEVPDWPWRNGRGWRSGCSVDTFTDFFVGVPPRDDDRYLMSFKTEGMNAESVRVYVNGSIYTAHRSGDAYTADVRIRYGSLRSPIVLATIEWSRSFDPPNGRLLEVELL